MFQEKYLKYKEKYLNLRGGVGDDDKDKNIEIVINKINKENTDATVKILEKMKENTDATVKILEKMKEFRKLSKSQQLLKGNIQQSKSNEENLDNLKKEIDDLIKQITDNKETLISIIKKYTENMGKEKKKFEEAKIPYTKENRGLYNLII